MRPMGQRANTQENECTHQLGAWRIKFVRSAPLDLPVCCLPISADQPIIAGRAVALGAGVSCANASFPSSPFPHVDPERLTSTDVRNAVRHLLADARFGVAARRLRAEIQALPGVDAAVESLERLASTKAPVVIA